MAFDYDAIEELEYEEHYQKAMRDLHGGRLDSQSPPQAEVVESDIHDNAVPVPAFPNGTAESQFEATQIQSQAATSASARPLPPPLPLVPRKLSMYPVGFLYYPIMPFANRIYTRCLSSH